MDILNLEAVLASVCIFASEIYIIYILHKSDRIQFAYHLQPTAHAILLLEAVRRPEDLGIQVFSYGYAVVTTLNFYNTLLPHSITTSNYIDFRTNPSGEQLLYDLFLPRYKNSWHRPWIFLLQFLYSIVVLVHIGFRSFALARSIEQL